MYVMRQRFTEDGRCRDSHLFEMTKGELAQAERLAKEAGDTLVDYVPISAARAHRHVKGGYVHSTTLWVDQGRIRKA